MLNWIDRYPRIALIVAIAVGSIGTLDSILSLSDRIGEIDLTNLAAIVSSVLDFGRILAGPFALILATFLLWRSRSQSLQQTDARRQIESLQRDLAAGQTRIRLEEGMTAASGNEEPSAASRWLPDRNNLSSFAMTNDDLDVALGVAERYLRDELGPDVVVEFQRMVVAVRGHYPTQVDFRGSSDLAQKASFISVFEEGYVYGQWSVDENLDIPADQMPPWQIDTSWADLVRNSWYRARHRVPAEGFDYGVLTYGSEPNPEGDDWGKWRICYGREAPGSIPQCYRFRSGFLEQDSDGQVEPFHWG